MSASPVRLLYCGDVQTGAGRLRDAGLEVVVLQPGVSPDQLAAVALQEDIDLVAVADAELGASVVGSLDEHVIVFWVTSALLPLPSR